MTTTEALYDRREFFAFARKKGVKPNRNIGAHCPSPQTEPPHWSNPTRRQVIAGLAITTIAATLLKPWEWFAPHEQTGPETLEDMVTEAKRMEDSFKDKDLSNKATRESYAKLLAGIYVFSYPGGFTKEQILASMTWTDSLDDFVKERLKSAEHPNLVEAQYRQSSPDTTAATDIRTKRMIVNTKASVYDQANLDQLNSPYRWNPLKMLRISLLHEFGHLITTNSDNELYNFVDPKNEMRNKVIEGFRITSVDDHGYPTIFSNQHEATIELLSKDLNERLFGSFFSSYVNDQGQNVDTTRTNLEQVLQATGITKREVSDLHKKSKLKEFLMLLMQKVGAKDTDLLTERLSVAFKLMNAVESNDQSYIQQFTALARSLNKTAK